MTVLWERRVQQTHYQVRRAGGSIRLYSNGVFHSQWNPKRSSAHSVWDLLSAPLSLVAAPEPRVLMLGVGGGAVINHSVELVPDAYIVGVERDPVHLEIARRWFGVRSRLCLADAVEWVRSYRGPPFDYLVDDLFGHVDGEAARVVPVGHAWLRRLKGLLAPHGVMVINHADKADWHRNVAGQIGFGHRARLGLPLYDNAIGIYRRCPFDFALRSSGARRPALIAAWRTLSSCVSKTSGPSL